MRRSWRRWEPRPSPRVARELVGECEAYLAGTYVERATHERVGVPAWALLNTIAHGDLQHIRAAARGAGPLRWALPLGWSRAARELAGEVAGLVGNDERRLATLQVEVLIPFELEFIHRHGQGGDVATALAWARAALHSVSG